MAPPSPRPSVLRCGVLAWVAIAAKYEAAAGDGSNFRGRLYGLAVEAAADLPADYWQVEDEDTEVMYFGRVDTRRPQAEPEVKG